MEIKPMAGRVVHVAWNALRLFSNSQGLSWGGAVGLYLFLSVPPLMVASSLMARVLVGQYRAENFIIDQAAKFLPARVDLVIQVFSSDAGSTIVTALVSLGFLLFSGTRAFSALAHGVNVMWHRSGRLSFWEAQATRLWLLLVSFVLLAAAALGEAAISAVTGQTNAANGQSWLLEFQVLPVFLLFVFLTIVYRVLPEDEVHWGQAAIGAAVATIGVRVSQAVMGVMSDLGTFETSYGALAGVALLATWSLVVGLVVLYGATIVAVLSGRLEQLEEDGDPDPDSNGG
jgi:membrane protein